MFALLRRLRRFRPRRAAQFARGRRGSVMTWAALLMVPLLGFLGLGLDTSRAYMVRARLSQALDSATLAAGRTNADDIAAEARAHNVFKANFPPGYMDAAVTGPNFVFNNTNHTVKSTATAEVPTYLMHLVGYPTYKVMVSSEVKRNASSLEIALVLDITGSMSGGKIWDLKTAAKDLIDTVVWDDQSQYYSKVAIVPYSNGVNVGAYAAQVRGAVASPLSISNATKSNPVVITAPNHGFKNGDKVFITGVKGMTQINNDTDNSPTATTNPQYWVVTGKTTNTFELTRSNGSDANGKKWNNYNSGGLIDCLAAGCEYQQFISASGSSRIFRISSCASERIGADAYTDASPGSAYLGRHYPADSNPCPSSTIVPLTPDRTLLKSKIDALSIGGSTAGQIGIAWGWYMISPEFGHLWPGASAPAAYGASELIKIAVIMTDGEFNTAYCNGVIGKDAGSGSGSSSDHINCNATNGSSASQALKQCQAMKQKGIVVFTVGFDLDTQSAKDLMRQCATNESYAYLASDGAALKEAFRSIAINISRLRLSR